MNGKSIHKLFKSPISCMEQYCGIYWNAIKHSQYKNRLIVDTVVSDTVFCIVSVLQTNCSMRSSMRTPVICDTNMICFKDTIYLIETFKFWVLMQIWRCLLLWLNNQSHTVHIESTFCLSVKDVYKHGMICIAVQKLHV